jgi:transcriptional regulator with XRE-family HTH domain
MSAIMKVEFMELGNRLKDLREKRGIATQAQLAKQLGFQQQTVSRWEAGISRPRVAQLKTVAGLLQASTKELMDLAGYTDTPVITSFDQPLPLSGLSEESFQRFGHYLLDRLYPSAKVHPAGTRGHKQHGIDINVELPIGEVHTYQCKRERQFGPAKVIEAVRAHTAVSDKQFILLSRVASPDARSEMARHEGWDIWDQDDLSCKFRGLAKTEQVALIDIFFPGQRFALIGETSPGPWVTSEHFFESFLIEGRLFTHRWQLVGRATEFNELEQALANDAVTTIQLIGNAGGGKSRLLRAALEQYVSVNTQVLVRVLSNDELTSKSLEDLGSGPKLLVIDDAHDRHEEVETIVRFVANPNANARLLLVYRPYAEDAVSTTLATVGLTGESAQSIKLKLPTKEDAKQLAEQVLSSLSAPVEYAAQLAEFGHESPLSIVIGAQILAKERLHPQLLRSSRDFTATVLKRYEKMILEDLGRGQDRNDLEAMLSVFSLLQPLVPDEHHVLSMLQSVANVAATNATRLTKLLIDSGVLFKRGVRYRLSPDLLADCFIESSCIGPNGTSNGFAEKLFSVAIPKHKENILLNLGRLDWRRHKGDTSESTLLEDLWNSLRWRGDYCEADLKAAVGAAYYQPKFALRFAHRLIAEGRGSEANVSQMIQNSAHNLKYVRQSFELLWMAARGDKRDLNNPYHPMRVLKELAAPKPNKPLDWCEIATDFAIAQIPFGDSWTSTYTPFEILKGVLETEGYTSTQSSPREISMMPYAIDPECMSPVRERIINQILSSIVQSRTREAFEASVLLQSALIGPRGIFNDTPDPNIVARWELEFDSTLEKLSHTLRDSAVPAVLFVQIAKSIRWHAFHEKKQGHLLARKIMKELDRDLETKLMRVLVDGWGNDTWPLDDRRNHSESFQAKLLNELHTAYPIAFDLVAFVGASLKRLSDFGLQLNSAHVFVNKLIDNSNTVALEVFEAYLLDAKSKLAAFAPFALDRLLQIDWQNFFSKIESLVSANDAHLAMVARCFTVRDFKPDIDDTLKRIILRVFQSSNPEVSQFAPWLLRGLTTHNRAFAIEAFANACESIPEAIIRDCFVFLCDENAEAINAMDHVQLVRVTNSLIRLQRLDDYHVRKFLNAAGRRDPEVVLKLALARVEAKKLPFHGLDDSKPLDLITTSRGPALLAEVLNWGVQRASDYTFTYYFSDLIHGAFGLEKEQTQVVLTEWANNGTEAHFQLLSVLISRAHCTFVIKYVPFVSRLLGAAQRVGQSAYKQLLFAFDSSASTGTRSSIWGHASKEDIHLRDSAEQTLAGLSQSDPAYELYRQLLESSKKAIQATLAEYELEAEGRDD